MKNLLIILILASLYGCGPSQTVDGQSNLIRYRDDRSGVTCWAIRGSHGISCLPDIQPQRQQTQAIERRPKGDTPAGEQFQTGPVPASTPTPRIQAEAFQL